jgi:hypothetical protein
MKMNNQTTTTTATAPTTAANEILDLRHLLRSAAGRDATMRRMIEAKIAKLESQASTATTAPATALTTAAKPFTMNSEIETEALSTELAAKAGKPVSRFFRNEARRQMKNRSLEAGGHKGTMPKEDRDAAAMAREYRSDRL